MIKIDWRGNGGYLFPDPGKLKSAICGVCNSKMKANRNVLGPISMAEALAGRKHRHDSFFCPNYTSEWHERIYHLKVNVYMAEINHLNNVDLKRLKRTTAKEIRQLLKNNATR